MIQRKGRKSKFWSYYHKIIDLCVEGNSELYGRVNDLDLDLKLERFYTLANIPQKYFKLDIDDIETFIKKNRENEKVTFPKVEKYIKNLEKHISKGTGLYLHGSHGIGKTSISAIILKNAIKLYYRCFFWKSSEIIEFIKSGWKNEQRRLFFDTIINSVDVLVIDDVARLFEEQKSEEKIFIDRIFTKRDDLNLVTILTANKTLEDSKFIFGDGLFSNFKERLIEINLLGKDFREEKAKTLEEQ
jgi:DNA replication protein DnaC